MRTVQSTPVLSRQQIKALQGLDNISAYGFRGVEMFEDVVTKLGERGKSSDWVAEVINLLLFLKSYLKDIYRLHISIS